MGYAKTIASTYLELVSNTHQLLKITTADGGFHDICLFSIPNFEGDISKSTLDLNVLEIYNTAAAENWLSQNQDIKVSPDAVTYTTAITLYGGAADDQAGFTLPSTGNLSGLRFMGSVDIKTLITSGGSLYVRWYNQKAHANELWAYSVTGILKIYFK